MGNQRRSFPNMQVAIKEIRDGVIGKAYYARAWYDNNRGVYRPRHRSRGPADPRL